MDPLTMEQLKELMRFFKPIRKEKISPSKIRKTAHILKEMRTDREKYLRMNRAERRKRMRQRAQSRRKSLRR